MQKFAVVRHDSIVSYIVCFILPDEQAPLSWDVVHEMIMDCDGTIVGLLHWNRLLFY